MLVIRRAIMSRRKRLQETKDHRAQMSPSEIRLDVRNYIQNDRDTVLRKWMALEEAVKSEDYRRENFYQRKLREDTRSLPVSIQKFIGTLKKAVRNTMRYKGGTPYSILRSMFLYWDADKSGEISSEELKGCMNSLGVRMSEADRDEVVEYYSTGGEGAQGEIEMNYAELLSDISLGEPNMIEDSASVKDDGGDIEMRYEEIQEERPPMTRSIEQFLEATRYWVMFRMRVEGGTPYYHIRNLFQFYDYDYSNGLNASELQIATKKGMKLTITDEQAEEVVKYYDRTGNGDIQYQDFLTDVSMFLKPVLHFTDITKKERADAIASLKRNPFMPIPFKAAPNKILESFKRKITLALADKINFTGGTVTQWLKEAFIYWDRNYTRRIKDWRVLQGVAKRLHILMDEEECHAIVAIYDKWGTGEMHYMELMKDMEAEEGSFLTEPENNGAVPATSRTPSDCETNIRRFRQAVEAYARKSGGVLLPRDVLHGTFLRFDRSARGRIDSSGVLMAAKELQVTLTDAEINDLVIWFDTNGSRQMDYNAFTAQMFGEDVMTKSIQLPKLHKLAGTATYNLTDTYKGNGSFDTSGGFDNNKKTMLVESQKAKMLRLMAKRDLVNKERKDVENKLLSIDEQKEKILEQYKLRHKEAREAYKRPPPQLFGISQKKNQKAPNSATSTFEALSTIPSIL